VTAVRIPLFDTHAVIAELRAEIDERIAAVIDSGRFIGGPEVESFERELAAYLGVEYVVGVANGTDALRLALLALGVGPGDEVVVPSFTFYASVEPIVHVGARPVFCDIDPQTFTVTVETVERALTPSTKAIIAVHLFGAPAPLDEIAPLARERDIPLVEDAAQSAGASLRGRKAGGLGEIAMFSFFPSKNLFCLGDGGAVATNDPELARTVALLRTHGTKDKQTYERIGFNSRLDAVQATVLRAVLGRLDDLNGRRSALATAYEEAGLGRHLALPRYPEGAEPVHHMYVTRADRPEDVERRLVESGIAVRGNYRVPVHRQRPMEPYGADADLPGTQEAAASNLALPMGPTHGARVARAVVDALSG
jgi:dTDP-4-amino-4,6-dideoxygalactose transaminase